MTKKLLQCIGIDPDRIRLEWISASEAPKFAQVIKDFVEEVRDIGPNPLSHRGEGRWTQTNFRAPDLYT
jgi:F420-non-reducing hydrogenase iron-sulfur subunit